MTVGLSVATMCGNVQNSVWLPWQPFKSRTLISRGLFVTTTRRNTELLVHNHVSPADVRPSNGFGSLAYCKDAAVVVPAVAAVGRTPSSEHNVFSHCVCMIFLFGWPPCQRSDMTLMEVSQRALDSLCIRNIWLLYIGMFFVNLIWYLYPFWLNKHHLSLSLSLSYVWMILTAIYM